MKILGLFLLVLSILFINGCFSSPITCNSPYIKVGSSCCLDQNINNICDSDESNLIIPNKNTAESSSDNDKITINSQVEQVKEGVIKETPNEIVLNPIGKHYDHTQSGYTLIVDDYTFDKKTEDYGVLKDITFILRNEQGSATVIPNMAVTVTDKKDSQFTVSQDVDLTEWVEDGNSIRRTVTVDLTIGALENNKELKVILTDWGKILNSVSFEVNFTKDSKLG